ncbi:hydrogenase [Melioribacter sp. Ez-97]|uniref:hydrogenase n=1 Tax=Melioribacter sp. Ez-97 TaxID=3423434 RepID=UPI003EDAF44C
MEDEIRLDYDHKLIKYGALLFLIGLLTGFLIPGLENPRMGLSSHLEGVQNGMLLMIFGVIWPKLSLKSGMLKTGYILALFGAYANWFTTLLAAFWGAGSVMMPIAGNSMQGTLVQEIIIKFGLISLSISMIIVSVLILLGLKKKLTVDNRQNNHL